MPLYSIYFPDLKNQIGDKKVKLKWAVAGRSSDKLAKVLMAVSLQHPKFDHASVDMIICDVTNEQSINEMAAQAKVLLNCVGPYRYVKMRKTEFHSISQYFEHLRFTGEKVVKACVKQGTNYVDISGEPQFLETMQLKYHEEAEKKGIYIVGKNKSLKNLRLQPLIYAILLLQIRVMWF